LGDLFKGTFSGSYRIDTEKGAIHLSNMIPLAPKMVPIMEAKESLELLVDTQNDTIKIDAPSLKAHFSTIPNGWKISLDDISRLSQKSPILRQYNINNGYLNLYYTGESSRYHFNGEIDYPYPLMLMNDAPVSHYRFSGSHQDNISSIRVNDRLVINHTPENIYIRANNTGLNMPALFKFLSAHKEESDASSKKEAPIPVRIHATNSYLYLMKGRKIVADTFDATLQNDNFDASLHHMNGSAILKIRNDLFSIDGQGFNDKFMEHLFALSDFSGGTFSFEAKGRTDAFDGLMRVENTILKDYKVLNNVLAFVNTVPSLTTFSLPNYNAKGLPVDEGYAHFAYKKGVVSVDNFTLNSPEMKITGTGRADFNANQLDGILTLKTDLGSSLGKVPMVGYILLGDDGSLATTLTLSGKLDDPEIDTAIAKEIVTAPFNILKRTLVYPFLWMMDDKKKK
ncbi:MAG TPA: AsmA-like C-terminal domain-containing protein, partial [Sulfuricurvum sp.]|nr:AsmA-like C-terminal domain-containing protein [Sulfuricurvum sp.]